MYINPVFSREKDRLLFPPPSIPRTASMSTVATPVSEEDLEAARMVLRSVIPSFRSSPSSIAVFKNSTDADSPPLPELISKHSQTDPPSADKVPLEGLVRAAGMSLANFAGELKVLEKRIDSQQSDLMSAIREIKRDLRSLNS